jgi:hypothetical protein
MLQTKPDNDLSAEVRHSLYTIASDLHLACRALETEDGNDTAIALERLLGRCKAQLEAIAGDHRLSKLEKGELRS